MKRYNKYIVGIVAFICFSTSVVNAKDTWWPEQKMPSQIIRVSTANLSERNLVQTISGLAARAVNAGTNNELIWTNVSGTAYNNYLNKWLNRTLVQDNGNISLWNLVDRYTAKGIIKGYVLYKDGDYSVNFATIYASIYNAILVEERFETTAISHGLTLKYDARSLNSTASYTQTWFNSVKSLLNNKMIVTIAPTDYRQREMAITNNCMVYWGVDDFYKSVLAWLEPNSPLVGWNEGDEGTAINACSEYGLFTTGATIVNLSILSAGSKDLPIARAKNVNPIEVNFSSKKNYLAYVMSDGGNMMIQATSMALADEYRANADIHNLPMSWASCPVNLIQMVPDSWNLFTEQSSATPGTLTEFNGGLYIDLYGLSRPNSTETIRREYAGLINKKLKSSGIKVFGCMTRYIGSAESLKAYQIYADSIEGLVGIIAIQYVPYNGGNGALYWVTNKAGKHIPVLTARYYLHNENLNYVNMGGPVTVANNINVTTASTEESFDWTIVHAWSYYTKDANGVVHDAVSTDSGAIRGVTPSMWSKSLLNNVSTISIEELLWRLRMKYYPQETAEIIRTYTPDSSDTTFEYPNSLEIDFSNLSTSSTDMTTAANPNNWYNASKYFWTSQYCYAQNMTSIPYIGKSIRFGTSTLENTGSATTPILNLKANANEDVVLRISAGCGSTKGGQLEIKLDNTVLATIDATKNGDSGSNGITFGAKMYDFEFVIPATYATGASTITLTHSRSSASEYIYISRFNIFRRNKLTANNTGTVDNFQMQLDNNTLKITGVTANTTIKVYSALGQLLIAKNSNSDMDINLGDIRNNQLLIVKVSDNKLNLFSKKILINKN